jgi:hypothetical protein
VDSVYNFLNNEPPRRFRPHIFCDSKFLELKPSNRLVQDKDGRQIPDPKRLGRFQTIKQLYGSKLTGQNKAFWIDSVSTTYPSCVFHCRSRSYVFLTTWHPNSSRYTYLASGNGVTGFANPRGTLVSPAPSNLTKTTTSLLPRS